MSDTDTPNLTTEKTELPLQSQPWLTVLENKLEDERAGFSDPTTITHHEIVRDLLLAPDDDDSAVETAVKRFYEDYKAGFGKEEFGLLNHPESGAGEFLNSISLVAFEAASWISFADARHDRLNNLLVGIKKDSAPEFKEDDPQFVYVGWGLDAAVAENWNHSQVHIYTKDTEWESAQQASDQWANIAALISKLFRDGSLDAEGPLRVTGDFRTALDKPSPDGYKTNIGRKCQALVTANHILIAGEALVKEVKTPSRRWWFELSEAKWKSWASKLQAVADEVDEDAEWDLKARAQRAHDKMVALYPEAFREPEVIQITQPKEEEPEVISAKPSNEEEPAASDTRKVKVDFQDETIEG